MPLLDRRSLLQLLPAALLALRGRGRAAREGDRGRPRMLGVRIGKMPTGRWNAITDVPGVAVGQATIVRGNGRLVVGEGPVRTGVTVIVPGEGVGAGFFPCGVSVPNGNGELTGLAQARTLGVLGTPIALTNTSSIGAVYAALAKRFDAGAEGSLEPVVGETWDGFLNDIEGRHVREEHVLAAVASARSGPVEEGAVGGGTGMVCYGFKGGIGTASRRLPAPLGTYTLGCLVQANHGVRDQLRIDGVPVGEEITDLRPSPDEASWGNSILMVLATDAPLLDHQLKRLAARAVHGLAKTGSISHNGSGDFALAFSTARRIPRDAFWAGDGYTLSSIEQFDLDPLLQAAAEATEESIVNALFAAVDTTGRDGHTVHALPVDRALAILERHHRLFPTEAEPTHARS
ncbi:MAG: P1 family peptidase [Thermoanaerobaculia bacterium]